MNVGLLAQCTQAAKQRTMDGVLMNMNEKKKGTTGNNWLYCWHMRFITQSHA